LFIFLHRNLDSCVKQIRSDGIYLFSELNFKVETVHTEGHVDASSEMSRPWREVVYDQSIKTIAAESCVTWDRIKH